MTILLLFFKFTCMCKCTYVGVCLSTLHLSFTHIPQTMECKANTHSSRHGVKSMRYLLCVEKACVNFLWQEKEASVCTAFNNELKGNSGHVTQMKEEMPSVVFFLHCICAIHSALLTYFAQGNCWLICWRLNKEWLIWWCARCDTSYW